MGIKRSIYLTNAKKFEGVINLELLAINYLDFDIELDDFDYLIFTSKNGVIAMDKQNSNWKNKKSLAISEQTANQIKLLGGDCVFVGQNGHGNDFALEILHLVKNKKSLYVRPKEVANNLEQIFESNDINYNNLIAYETSCITNFAVQNFDENSIFIFTSPKAFNCFNQNIVWNPSWLAIAIGKTTANAFSKHINCHIPNKPSIEDCVSLAKSL